MSYLTAEKCDNLKDDRAIDYGEEAIPERDPAYRRPTGTLCDPETVEYISLEERRHLTRRLEQLGMRPAKAVFLAAL